MPSFWRLQLYLGSELMKFQPEKLSGQAVVQGYDASGVVINGIKHAKSMVFGQELAPIEWLHLSEGKLTLEASKWVYEQSPKTTEVLIIGTGDKQIFPDIEIRRFFVQNGIPVEFMDSHAACRTYNILMGEGRAVVAAVLI